MEGQSKFHFSVSFDTHFETRDNHPLPFHPIQMGSKQDDVGEVAGIEDLRDVETSQMDAKGLTAELINQEHKELYLEALQRHPVNESLDRDAERKLVRKLDMQIIPVLGICYFFYVSQSSHWIIAYCSANDGSIG